MSNFIVEILATVLSVVFLSGCAYTDIKYLKIKNKWLLINLIPALTILLLRYIVLKDYLWSTLSIVLMIILFFTGMTKFIGLGDIKALMILCLYNNPLIILFTFILGGVLDVFYHIYVNKHIRNKFENLDKAHFAQEIYINGKKDIYCAFSVFLLFGYTIIKVFYILF